MSDSAQKIDPGKKVYIIAEAGVNHNGSLAMAQQLIDVAAEACADAIKFQTFKAERIISKTAPKAEYQIAATREQQESQLEMVKRLELSEAAHQVLIKHCRKRGIEFLSTPFDSESIDLLIQQLKVSQLKIPSGEITNGPLLLKAALSGKPIILSTGMSTLGEVETALGVLAFGYLNRAEQPSIRAFQDAYVSSPGQIQLRRKVTLLHCTTEYPAPFNEVNLRAMDTLRTAFGLPVGLSDHTQGIAVSIGAVARGAAMIEKHFTLDKKLPGPDHQASLDPNELIMMIKSIREVEAALGELIKTPSPSEYKNQRVVRKSLVAAGPIAEGETFTEDNLTAKRPGNGVSPMLYWELLGKKAMKNYQPDEMAP